jgi:hypothetical protein
MIKLKSGQTAAGIKEFYFLYLDNWDDFDSVVDALQEIGVTFLEKIDGIYFRIANLEFESHRFQIIYHEDVGVYSLLMEEQSDVSNDWLAQILEKTITILLHKESR